MRKKKTTSKCHLLKTLYRALRAKTFNRQKKMIIMIVVLKILGFTKYNNQSR